MVQTKADTGEARSRTATGLTLDQYIKRYATQLKPMSQSAWVESMTDLNGDGKLSNAEKRNFNKRFATQDDINKGYADYLDTVSKANAYYKREAEKEWEAAHYFAQDGVKYENAFASNTQQTMAQERAANSFKNEGMTMLLNTGSLLLYAAIGVALILILKK